MKGFLHTTLYPPCRTIALRNKQTVHVDDVSIDDIDIDEIKKEHVDYNCWSVLLYLKY